MKRQRGIADGWVLLIVLATMSGGLWYAYNTIDKRGYQRGRMEVQAEFVAFKVEQTRLAIEQAEKDRRLQEKSNETSKRTLAALHADIDRLRRDADKRASALPPPPPGAKRPDRATIDRAEFERAYRELVQEVRRIAQEGDEARVKLDTAKEWAR